MEELDIANAAIKGEHNPATASGTAMMLYQVAMLKF